MSAKFVSSKSWAWPAAPLARAAQPGAVRSDVPTTVHSGVPPSARATARTPAATGSAAPASMTPIVSRAARRVCASTASEQSRNDVLTTNSARRVVAVMARTIAEGPGGCKGRAGDRQSSP